MMDLQTPEFDDDDNININNNNNNNNKKKDKVGFYRAVSQPTRVNTPRLTKTGLVGIIQFSIHCVICC